MYYPYMISTIISRSTLILRIIHSLYVIMSCIDLTKQDGCQPWQSEAWSIYLARWVLRPLMRPLIFPFGSQKPKKKQQQSTLQILTPISKVLLVVQGYKLIPPSIVCLILNKNGDSSVYIYICIYITPPPFPVDD